MSRLDKQRQLDLQPKRMAYAVKTIREKGYVPVQVNENEIYFNYKDKIIRYFPYSGWHTGKSIKDGRGFHNLIKQI